MTTEYMPYMRTFIGLHNVAHKGQVAWVITEAVCTWACMACICSSRLSLIRFADSLLVTRLQAIQALCCSHTAAPSGSQTYKSCTTELVLQNY